MSVILGMISHATITGVGGGFEQWPQALDQAKQNDQVVGAAPYIERETMIRGRRISGAIIRGVLPDRERTVSELAEQMVVGELAQLAPGEYRIVLGVELAYALGADVGDRVAVFAPEIRTTAAGVIPQVRRFVVAGIFEAGMHEYDRSLGVVHLQDAQKLFRMGESVTGVRLKLHDLFLAWQVARDLATDMGGMFRVRDWTQQHANFFRAVKTEKTVMFVILSLIIRRGRI